MKNFKNICLIIITISIGCCRTSLQKESISFYEVPLECGAAPEIGCGSRIKPLFIDLEKESLVDAAWTNWEGSVLAIKWKEADTDPAAKEKLLTGLFKKRDIETNYISDKRIIDSLQSSLLTDNTKWLKGMAVDSLSYYEAAVIAHTLSDFAAEAKLISKNEQDSIRRDLTAYFKKELVKVRTEDELKMEETQAKWYKDGFAIYQKYIGNTRTEVVDKYFKEHKIQIMKKESCCSEDKECKEEKNKEQSSLSTITCPNCGYKKQELLPTDICLLKYTCEKCHTVLQPKNGDCCVFCSYGNHKCPSKQDG
jgi:hypothetical protein